MTLLKLLTLLDLVTLLTLLREQVYGGTDRLLEVRCVFGIQTIDRTGALFPEFTRAYKHG
jgi:hypothetical protein